MGEHSESYNAQQYSSHVNNHLYVKMLVCTRVSLLEIEGSRVTKAKTDIRRHAYSMTKGCPMTNYDGTQLTNSSGVRNDLNGNITVLGCNEDRAAIRARDGVGQDRLEGVIRAREPGREGRELKIKS
jgi:hypothetical protein